MYLPANRLFKTIYSGPKVERRNHEENNINLMSQRRRGDLKIIQISKKVNIHPIGSLIITKSNQNCF